MRTLNGASVIITGASAGIGLHLARTLAAEGMHLALAARSGDKLRAVADELRRGGTRAIAVATDVTDPNHLQELVERTLDEYGRIDVLINNAGVETYHLYEELDIEDIIRTVEVNLTATLVSSRLVLPHMLRAGRGHIVNMSSTAGKHGPAYGGAYGASKAGMVSFTESLRAEYRGSGVSASVICPGFTNSGGMYERMKADIGRGTPLQMGSTSTAAVGRAVVKAIKQDKPELIVNWPPVRPAIVLAELFPRLGQWIVRKSTSRYLRKVARSRSPMDDGSTQSAIIQGEVPPQRLKRAS